MKRHTGLLLVSLSLLVMALFLIANKLSQPTFLQLEPNRIYDSYDFNRDGKKDIFRFEIPTSPRGDAYFYLNNTKSTIFVARGAGILYYRYSKTDEFLIVNFSVYGGTEVDIYKFVGDKAERVQILEKDDFQWGVVDTATGSSLSVLVGPYHSHQWKALMQAMDNADDIILLKKVYKLNTKDHLFESESPYLIPTKKWELKLTSVADSSLLNTSSEYDTDNKLGIKLVEGETYTLEKVAIIESEEPSGYIPNLTRRIQLKDRDGKTGWISSSSDWVFS